MSQSQVQEVRVVEGSARGRREVVLVCNYTSDDVPVHTFVRDYEHRNRKYCCKEHRYAASRREPPTPPTEEEKWERELLRRKRSADSRRGAKRTPEQRQRMSKAIKSLRESGHYDNVDYSKSKETSEKISRRIKEKWAEGAYDNMDLSYRTEEFLKRHSEKMKERFKQGLGTLPVHTGPMPPEWRRSHKEAMSRPEVRKRLSESQRRSYMSGRSAFCNPHFSRRTVYHDITFRSQSEAIFAERLDLLGVTWVYEPKRFDLVECTYLPDFYLPVHDLWVEVKGYMDPMSQKRVDLFRKTGRKLVVMSYYDVRDEHNSFFEQMEVSA